MHSTLTSRCIASSLCPVAAGCSFAPSKMIIHVDTLLIALAISLTHTTLSNSYITIARYFVWHSRTFYRHALGLARVNDTRYTHAGLSESRSFDGRKSGCRKWRSTLEYRKRDHLYLDKSSSQIPRRSSWHSRSNKAERTLYVTVISTQRQIFWYDSRYTDCHRLIFKTRIRILAP